MDPITLWNTGSIGGGNHTDAKLFVGTAHHVLEERCLGKPLLLVPVHQLAVVATLVIGHQNGKVSIGLGVNQRNDLAGQAPLCGPVVEDKFSDGHHLALIFTENSNPTRKENDVTEDSSPTMKKKKFNDLDDDAIIAVCSFQFFVLYN